MNGYGPIILTQLTEAKKKIVLLVFLYCFYILLAVSKQNTQAQRAHTHARTNAHTHA